MTKAKLARLIELSKSTAILRPYREYEELVVLQAEFAAWEPELAELSRADANHFEQEAVNPRQERDEARRAAHEIIDSVTSVVDGATGQKIWSRAVQKWPWLREIADQ